MGRKKRDQINAAMAASRPKLVERIENSALPADAPTAEIPVVQAAKPKKVAKPRADGLVALPRMKRARKPKAPKQCECGCGLMTRGGRFFPGHDSRLKGWLLRIERGLIKLEDIPEGERAAVKRHMKPVSEAVNG